MERGDVGSAPSKADGDSNTLALQRVAPVGKGGYFGCNAIDPRVVQCKVRHKIPFDTSRHRLTWVCGTPFRELIWGVLPGCMVVTVRPISTLIPKARALGAAHKAFWNTFANTSVIVLFLVPSSNLQVEVPQKTFTLFGIWFVPVEIPSFLQKLHQVQGWANCSPCSSQPEFSTTWLPLAERLVAARPRGHRQDHAHELVLRGLPRGGARGGRWLPRRFLGRGRGWFAAFRVPGGSGLLIPTGLEVLIVDHFLQGRHTSRFMKARIGGLTHCR